MKTIFSWIIPAIEISMISVIVYYLISFFWNTRAMNLILGLIAVAFVYALSIWLHLPVIEKLMHYFVSVAVIALLIIFQPELRLALSKLSVKGKKYREITEFDKFLESISQSIYRM
jgi:diadenylate cyclase